MLIIFTHKDIGKFNLLKSFTKYLTAQRGTRVRVGVGVGGVVGGNKKKPCTTSKLGLNSREQ